MRNREKSIR